MTTIHDLTRALGYALEHRPAEQSTILKGFALAMQPGAVDATRTPALVASQDQEHRPGSYLVRRDACTCQAHSRHPERRCTHIWALLLVLAAQTLAEDTAPRPSLVDQVCNPAIRHARELAGFPGAVPRHQ